MIATESGFNQTVQKDQASLIAELISRVTSLEDDMEFVLKHIRILEVDRQIEVISPSWEEKNDMEATEAITQLEIIATNMVGRLAESEDEREAKIISKQLDALDMGIDALKKLGE